MNTTTTAYTPTRRGATIADRWNALHRAGVVAGVAAADAVRRDWPAARRHLRRAAVFCRSAAALRGPRWVQRDGTVTYGQHGPAAPTSHGRQVG